MTYKSEIRISKHETNSNTKIQVLKDFEPFGKDKMTVDEFVKAGVLPEFHPVVATLRELMRQAAPNASEMISYGIPAYKGRKIFAVISPTKKDITLSFSHGKEFEDKYGLLKGDGKVSRYVKMKNIPAINKEALRYYIKQALEIDAR